MKKRILSMIICLAMVLTLLPAAVFASGSKIGIVTVNVPYSLADGQEMFFDNSLITVGDPALYRAYLWAYSWTGPDGIYMPDEYNMPHFKGGERYTLMVLIVPEDGATGLDSSTAPFLPVYINGMRARFNPACSPWLEEAPYKTTYAYEIDLQCPYANVIDIVEIFGFTPPTPGAVPCDINDLSVPENAPYYIHSVTWERYLGVPPTSGARDMAAGETFTDGVYYFLIVKLCPYDGYTFSAGDVTWRINGTSYNGYVDSYSLVSAPTEARLYSTDLKAESRHIDYIDIEGLGAFYEGATARSAIENVTAPDAEGYTLFFDEDTVISAESDNTYIDATDVFQSGETYRATFCARPDPGWTIDKETVWRINGSTDLVQYAQKTADYWYVKSIYIASAAKTPIEEVYIYGYETPKVDQTAGDCLNMFVVGELYELVDAYWFCDTDSIHMKETDTFKEGKLYSACVVVRLRDPSFTIDDTTVFYLNGGEFAVERSGARTNGDYYVWTEQMEAITPTLTHIVSWYLDPADDFAVTGVEVEDGEVFGEPAAPAKDGYTFGGWFTDRACTVPYDPTAPIHEDIELFPLWIPAPVGTPITAVDAQIPVPIAGQEPAGTASVTLTSTPEGAPLSISALTWFYWDDTLPVENKWMDVPASDYVFEAGKTYAVDIFVRTEDGSDYVFDPAVVGTVNGQPSDDSYDDIYQDAVTAYLSYVWTAEEAPADILITEVSIDGFEEPRAGELPIEADALTVPEDAHYSISSLVWYLAPDSYTADFFTGPFVEGNAYFADICVTPDEGYAFAEDTVVKINGLIVTDWFPFLDPSGDFCIDSPDIIAEGTPVYIPITAVNAQVPEPVVGQKPAGKSDIVVTSTPSDADITIGDLLWYYWNESYDPDGEWILIKDSDYVFEADKIYALDLYLCTQDDYGFDKAVDGTVNGEPSDTTYGAVYTSLNEVYLSYSWAAGELPADPCEGYTDIDRSSWYHTAADFVIERGYMGSTKTDALTFEPNTKVSRAMVASILYRMAGSPAVEYKATFTDVPADKWFTSAIEWCAQNGLASGKGNGKFDPNGNVTRQELAVFMMKTAEYFGEATTGRADLSTFADAGKVPAWAKTYLEWAVNAGLISGKANGGKTYLAPTDNATRAEFASIIMRFCDKFGS